MTLKHFLERDERLAAAKTHLQEAVMDNLQQVVVILGIKLDKQVILTRCEVAFNHLRNSLKSGNNLIKL